LQLGLRMTTASPHLRSFVTCLLVGACALDPPPASVTRAPIVGGVDASDPAVVVILVDGEGDCTGSLVAPDVVLTAAHCILEDIPAGAVFTVFTGPDLAQPDGGETVDVAMARPNPAWDLEDDSGDVAVLVLARPLTIPPVRINRTPLTEDLVGQAARMVGYGDTTAMEPTTGFGRRLQATRPLLDFDHDWVVVGDATGNQCYGDSGGPVFMTIGGSEVIVGVNSWGPHDDCDTFSYNARIDSSLPFVDMYVPPSNDPPPGGEDMDDIDLNSCPRPSCMRIASAANSLASARTRK
jgi:V8-like Glu-specific endopeptidase